MVDETTGQNAASNPTPDTGGIPTAPAGAAQSNPLNAPVSVGSDPSQAPTSSEPSEGALGNDIAKILKDVKLPTRPENVPGKEQRPAAQTKDIDALLSGTPTQAQPASQVAPAKPELASEAPAPTKDAVQSVHTLKQDLQQVVHDQKISVVRAAALEQEKQRVPEEIVVKPHSNRVKNFFFAAFLLLFLGGAALGGVYIVMQSRTQPLPEQQTNSLVFAEQTVPLPLDGQTSTQLKGLLGGVRDASTGSLGSITRIAPLKVVSSQEGETTRLATLSEFFSAIGVTPPGDLTRALSDDFFFGLHTIDRNAPLLVIPVLSYDRAFAGMLAWESSINAQLAPIFVRVPDLILGADGIPARRTFTDIVMRNYDVRALTDDSGAVALYYAFPTRNILVIAENPHSFTELLSRLQAQRKL
jgi:hypothetical protein